MAMIAADQLLAEHEPALRNFLGARCRDADLTAEMLQEVAARLVTASPRLSLNGNARGYLFRIAANVWRDHLRRELVRRRAAVVLESAEPPLADPADARLLERELRAAVRNAVRALPPAQREVVELRQQRGLTFQEIADRLGRPLGTVLTQMRAALARISAALENYRCIIRPKTSCCFSRMAGSQSRRRAKSNRMWPRAACARASWLSSNARASRSTWQCRNAADRSSSGLRSARSRLPPRSPVCCSPGCRRAMRPGAVGIRRRCGQPRRATSRAETRWWISTPDSLDSNRSGLMRCRISRSLLAAAGLLLTASAVRAQDQGPMPNPQAMQMQAQQIAQQRPREAEAAARAFLHVISTQKGQGPAESSIALLDQLKGSDVDAYWGEVGQLTVQFDLVQNLARRDSVRAGLVTQMFGLESMARTLQRAYRGANEIQRETIRGQLEKLIGAHYDFENQLRLLEIKDIERRLGEVRAETQRRLDKRADFIKFAVDDIIRDAIRPR